MKAETGNAIESQRGENGLPSPENKPKLQAYGQFCCGHAATVGTRGLSKKDGAAPTETLGKGCQTCVVQMPLLFLLQGAGTRRKPEE